MECTNGIDQTAAVQRLHRYKKTFPSGSLQYVPVLYYVHGFMSVYHPDSRLTASSTETAAEGKECYTRDSAERLLEVLHLASKKANLVSQYPTFKLFGFLLFSSNLKV